MSRPAEPASGPAMKAVSLDGYELRPLDLSAAGVGEISRLLLEVFPAATYLTPDYIDWMYNHNPAGRAIGANAYHGDRPVGHYVTIPLRARLFGIESLGALNVNAAVHPDHRGKRLYTRLGEMTHEWLAAQGWEFVIAVPNAMGTPVFVATLGFQLVGTLQARVGLGPIRREALSTPADYERIWDEPTLRWRLGGPRAEYTLRRRSGRWEVRAPSGRPLISVLLGALDAGLLEDARAGSARPLTLFIGSDPDIRWGRSLYWNLPQQLRPAPLNFVFLDLSGRRRRLDISRLRYAALDFDAY